MYYDLSRSQHEGLVKAYYAGTQKGSKVMHFLSTTTQLVSIEKLPDSLEIDHQCNCECSPAENTEQPHGGPEEAFG
jgi:hypothetical protein